MNRPEWLANTPTPVCIWSLENLYRLFPTLRDAIANSASYKQTGGYLAFYFWFHQSLIYWLKMYRNQFPHVKYLWRIEPDVLFSGDISQARDAISADLRDARWPISADLGRSPRGKMCHLGAISARSRRCVITADLRAAISARSRRDLGAISACMRRRCSRAHGPRKRTCCCRSP